MFYEAIRPTSNPNATVSKKAEQSFDTKTNSTNGILKNPINNESKKVDIQKNGNGNISNGKNSDTSESDFSDSDKETSNNKNIIPLPYITSQNFSSNACLNNNNKNTNLLEKTNNDTQKLVINGNDNNDNNNFVKKWENKYVFNDKKSSQPSPLKSDLSKNNDSDSSNKIRLDFSKNIINKNENKCNVSNNGNNDNNNFMKKWLENKHANDNGHKEDNDHAKVTKLVPYDVNDSSR